MKKYPNITLKIIFKYKNRILILKRKDKVFDFPGGRLEWKEAIEDALKREIMEELRYSLKEKPKLFDIWNYISKNGKRHSVMIYFICVLGKKPEFHPSGKTQILWLSKEDFLRMNIIDDEKFLNKIF